MNRKRGPATNRKAGPNVANICFQTSHPRRAGHWRMEANGKSWETQLSAPRWDSDHGIRGPLPGSCASTELGKPKLDLGKAWMVLIWGTEFWRRGPSSIFPGRSWKVCKDCCAVRCWSTFKGEWRPEEMVGTVLCGSHQLGPRQSSHLARLRHCGWEQVLKERLAQSSPRVVGGKSLVLQRPGRLDSEAVSATACHLVNLHSWKLLAKPTVNKVKGECLKCKRSEVVGVTWSEDGSSL